MISILHHYVTITRTIQSINTLLQNQYDAPLVCLPCRLILFSLSFLKVCSLPICPQTFHYKFVTSSLRISLRVLLQLSLLSRYQDKLYYKLPQLPAMLRLILIGISDTIFDCLCRCCLIHYHCSHLTTTPSKLCNAIE